MKHEIGVHAVRRPRSETFNIWTNVDPLNDMTGSCSGHLFDTSSELLCLDFFQTALLPSSPPSHRHINVSASWRTTTNLVGIAHMSHADTMVSGGCRRAETPNTRSSCQKKSRPRRVRLTTHAVAPIAESQQTTASHD